ncbi:hypothetical protein [Sphingomonas sp. 8AM]|uniref:hypothetical protein n=1 Tax=Sphingomonas sp. 8AM TaxID=2653170 RepID=UPI0012EF322F|nr:hypothetical protein [Sphingomonas sp. 8AM]VXC85928.1 conserved exported hypothetical protein [Sphingomonas sp. 8AM]
MKNLIVAAALVAAIAAPAQAARSSPDADLARLLKGRVAEAPVRCIPVSPTDGNSVQIISERALAWRIGSRIYVNVPQARAETLDDDDILITEPFGGQLCRNDQVRPLNRGSRIPKASLLLGNFTPYVRSRAR